MIFSETYCTHGGDHGDCPICAKYKYYFESPQETAVSHVNHILLINAHVDSNLHISNALNIF